MTDADLILTGGTVHTLHGPSTTALAVRGGTVLATLDTEDVGALTGPRTRRIDLDGRTVVPGFVDAHVHPVHAGLALSACSLDDARDAAHAVELVARYAGEHPDEPWITGGGWSMEWFAGGTPSRTLLDEVVADRPVLLANRDGHGAWTNTAALLLAGVDAATPDPVDGRIEREPDGAPQGTLHEGAVDLVARLRPAPTADDLMQGLLLAQRHLHSLGITGWQDAIVGHYASMPDVLATYLRAAQERVLTARVVGALWWDRSRGLEQIPDLLARRDLATGHERFRATTVKIMQDGVAENFTAGMLTPYLDLCGHPTDNTGLSYVDPDALRAAAVALDREGFQLHVHAIGDRAVRQALDAIGAALEQNGDTDRRHQLAHLQVVHPDDVPRFGELGVTANIQALWAAHEPQMDELTIPFLGPERSTWQYPFADVARHGARLCAGSDWPVSSADPLQAIHVAVNRRAHGSTEPPLLPEQALSVDMMLRAYTTGSAWSNHLDSVAGDLAVGKVADFAILTGDPLSAPSEQIGDLHVTDTFIDGESVYGG